MFGLGIPEILAILAVILLIFGAGRLPEIGRSLGRGISEFKKGVNDHTEDKTKKDEKDQ